MAQHFDAALGHHAIILDPHPELSALINPRLDREHHARLEARRVAIDEIGRLVAIHAEAMAEAVREEGAVAAVADRRARGTVHLLSLRIERLARRLAAGRCAAASI